MPYTYYLTDCSQTSFEDCYYGGKIGGVFVKAVEAGDTIVLPSGSATWGNGSRFNQGVVYVILPITIRGQGDSTIITLDNTGVTYTRGVLSLWSRVTLADMKIIGSSANPVSAISSGPYNNSGVPGGINYTGGVRITNVTFQGGNGAGYFFYAGKILNALIDNCRISGATGNSELIFARGPDNAWQNNNTLGGENNVFIEDCTFSGTGYVNDANSNARMVVRFCTINGNIKVDGHGLASNGAPARGFRCMETYHNTWTHNVTNPIWTAIEIRGGTNMIFNNTTTTTYGNFFMTDYGYLAAWPNFGSVYQTPVNYPITDQIGVSKDPKTAAGEPNYIWGNRFAGSAWARQLKTPAAGAITLYQSQTSNPSATFTERDLIQANRDFYAEAGFDTAAPGGVSIGTTSEMSALTPPFNKYGFWVTDQGTWNKTIGGTQGKLYTWNGSSWTAYYEPYTYPHPSRGITPVAPTVKRLKRNSRHLKLKAFSF